MDTLTKGGVLALQNGSQAYYGLWCISLMEGARKG